MSGEKPGLSRPEDELTAVPLRMHGPGPHLWQKSSFHPLALLLSIGYNRGGSPQASSCQRDHFRSLLDHRTVLGLSSGVQRSHHRALKDATRGGCSALCPLHGGREMKTESTLLFVPVPKIEMIQTVVLFQQNSSQMGITAKS